jgi:hypothetical protein
MDVESFLSLVSHRKIMSVQSAVMAMILANCLYQSVDMFSELQFCTEKVILGTERTRVLEDHSPRGAVGPVRVGLGEIIHLVRVPQGLEFSSVQGVKGDFFT